MRLATFNVENLFRRPVVLDQPTWADGREQLNDYTTFNGVISKASYSGTDKKWLVDFLDRYDMADHRIGKDDPFQLNEVRGKLFKVPKGQTEAEIIVDGRDDWDGWLGIAPAHHYREHGACGRGVERRRPGGRGGRGPYRLAAVQRQLPRPAGRGLYVQHAH